VINIKEKIPVHNVLKEHMRGHHFPSVEEVSPTVTQAIRRLNKTGTLNGIAYLPKCWDAVIEKQGDYNGVS
jgi:hypothetical protein